MSPLEQNKKRAAALHKRLRRAIIEPACELDHDGPWQLLVATILSAQSTDKMVNRVTPALFARWPDPKALAQAQSAEVQALIKPTGFFRNKAKSIQGAAELLCSRFDGQVPATLEDLVSLPGVARKTANVVLGTAFGIASGITVDTHAGRVARRLELTAEKDPVKVERALCALFPKRSWIELGHRLVLHGRYVCQSKKPACSRCPLNELCPSVEAPAQTRSWTRRAAAQQRTVASRGQEPLLCD